MSDDTGWNSLLACVVLELAKRSSMASDFQYFYWPRAGDDAWAGDNLVDIFRVDCDRYGDRVGDVLTQQTANSSPLNAPHCRRMVLLGRL